MGVHLTLVVTGLQLFVVGMSIRLDLDLLNKIKKSDCSIICSFIPVIHIYSHPIHEGFA